MRRHLWWVLGLVLVVGGLVLALSAQAQPDDLGWFAYVPSNDAADWTMGWQDSTSGSVLLVSRWRLAGAALGAIGLIVIAAGAGFHLGRRTAVRRPAA